MVYSPKEDIHITPSKAQWTFVEEEVERAQDPEDGETYSKKTSFGHNKAIVLMNSQ